MFLLTAFMAHAQFTTPGTGVKWDLQTLAANSEGVITQVGDHFEMDGILIISATDTIEILSNGTLLFHGLSHIESNGALIVDAPDQMTFSAVDPEAESRWRGIRFYEGHYTYLRNATFEYGGGLKVGNGGTFLMDGCTVRFTYYQSGSTSGSLTSSGAIDITGPATVINSNIYSNQRPAIGTPSNISSPVNIRYNTITGNTTENSNRPQINLGLAGAGNTSYVVGNTIIGDEAFTNAGGIAYSHLLSGAGQVVIDSNTIVNNRYGITLTGSGIDGWIRYNTITDNNTQNNPALGGSGINLTASSSSAYQSVMVTGNLISGNLWGITIIGYPQVNMGNTDPESFNPGLNVFSGNGNEGVTYDLYNNGPVNQFAMGNLWDVEVQDAESIETVVTHQPDDSSLGLVSFMPAAQKVTFTAANNDSEALEGVTITIEGIDPLTTDIEGLANLITMQGQYDFTATIEGYEDFSGSFTLAAEPLQVPITMSEVTYTVSFEVTHGTDPLEDAVVNIDGQEITTGADGIASIDLVPGDYAFEVSLDGYETFTGAVTLVDQDVTVQVTLLETEYTLTFVVTSADNPLEGATIDIAGTSLTTDAAGEATILLVNGSYPYEVTATDHTTATGEAVVSGADLDITVTLTSTVGITEVPGFRIYPNPASSYVRIEGANIQKAELLQLHGMVVRTFENPDANLNLQGLSPGYYFLRLYTDGQIVVRRLMIR